MLKFFKRLEIVLGEKGGRYVPLKLTWNTVKPYTPESWILLLGVPYSGSVLKRLCIELGVMVVQARDTRVGVGDAAPKDARAAKRSGIVQCILRNLSSKLDTGRGLKIWTVLMNW